MAENQEKSEQGGQDAAVPSEAGIPEQASAAGAAGNTASPGTKAATADDPADEAMDAVASIENQLGQMLSNLGGMVGGERSFAATSRQEPSSASATNIDLLRDVVLNVKIELGRSRMYIEDILKLGEGSVVELEKLAGDPVDVFVNDRLIARGEVLVLNDNFCVRIGEIISQD